LIKVKKQKLKRWGFMLQNFKLVIKHIEGKDNAIADALSRVG
jgi:hypothetical protein